MGEGMGSVALYVRFSKKYLFIYIKKYHARFFMKITTWLVYDVSRCRHKTVRTLERGGGVLKSVRNSIFDSYFLKGLLQDGKYVSPVSLLPQKKIPPQN